MPYEIDLDPQWRSAINRIIAENAAQQGALIQILEQTQKETGYLPENVQAFIADKLDIPLSEVYGVATFYSLFNTEPVGLHTISICMGTACYVKGAGEIVAEFERLLDIKAGETTRDGKFTLEACRCLGACGLAPVLTLDGQVHGRLTPADVPGLLSPDKEKSSEKV